MSRLIGALAAGIMTVGMVWAISAMKPAKLAICWLVTIGFAVATGALAFVMIRDLRTRLELHERALVYHRGSTERVVAYDPIANAKVFSVNGRPAALILDLHDSKTVRIVDALGARLSSSDLPLARVVPR
jgi:hypothetical protein